MEGVLHFTTAEQGDPARGHIYIFAGSGLPGALDFLQARGSLGPGAEFMNFHHFQGPEHVKHEGLGLSGGENSMKIYEKSV